MKRLLLALATMAFATTASCGLYTNVPAQIKVAQVSGATLTYEQPNATDGWRNVKVEPASVTLVGEPGSIGVTFDRMEIDYFQINNVRVPSADVPPQTLRVTLRVESSNFPTDPLAGPLTRAQLGTTLQVGQTKAPLPIVTRHLSAYGAKADANVAALWAQVVLKGTDDAGFPAELAIYVPITFLGPPTGVKV